MNKREFKRYMQQGLGRCVLELKNAKNIEKYKEIVLWGCLHNLSYDTQCEGTRASYVYELTTYFDDEQYFVFPLINAFERLPRRLDWTFSHFCELLRRFAENGNVDAKNALYRKYDNLLSTLISKRRFTSYDFERDNFDEICLAIDSLEGTDGLLRIASDMGRLFRENPHYDGSDFDWCMDCGKGEKILLPILRRESKKSQNLRCFYENYLKTQEEMKQIVRNPATVPSVEDIKDEISLSGKLSPSTRVRFGRHADSDEKLKLAEEVLAEPDLDAKAELLSTFAFRNENFPLSHSVIIEYSNASHEKLRENAFGVLINCQSEEVRAYALELLANRTHMTYAIEMLLCNYKTEDKQLLLDELYKIRADYKDGSDWHGIGSHILDVKDQNIKLPKEFFFYIYETTLCSCCREYAVLDLSKRRLMTKEMIEECRYDSNHSIVEYINRRYIPTNTTNLKG